MFKITAATSPPIRTFLSSGPTRSQVGEPWQRGGLHSEIEVTNILNHPKSFSQVTKNNWS